MIEHTNCINSVSMFSAMFVHVFTLCCVRELTLLVLFIIHKNYSALLHANYNKLMTKYYQQIQEVLLQWVRMLIDSVTVASETALLQSIVFIQNVSKLISVGTRSLSTVNSLYCPGQSLQNKCELFWWEHPPRSTTSWHTCHATECGFGWIKSFGWS